jgi:hypothetical protein
VSARLFSIIRRKPGLVDFVTPLVAGQEGYRLKTASNFDGSFTTILTTTNTGYVDPTIDLRQQTVQTGNIVRMLINPTTFSLTDTAPFWLQYVPVVGGIEGTPSGLLLVLPPTYGTSILAISGNAPNGANQAASLRLDFPRLVTDLHIHNEHASADLVVAFDASGPEIKIQAPQKDPQFSSIHGAHASIWVRGSGAVVPFSATFTFANPK